MYLSTCTDEKLATWTAMDVTEERLLAKEGDLTATLMVGSPFSSEAFMTSTVLSKYNITLISPSATSATLSDKANHPSFNRVVAPDNVQAVAIISLLKRMNWNRVAYFASNNRYSNDIAQAFVQETKDDPEVEILSGRSFVTSASIEQVTQHMNVVRQSGARIVLLFELDVFIDIVLEAATLAGVTFENGYQLVGVDGWFSTQPATAMGRRTVRFSIGTNPYYSTESDAYLEFRDRWAALPTSITYSSVPSVYAPFYYDAMLHAANALHRLYLLQDYCEIEGSFDEQCADYAEKGPDRYLTEIMRTVATPNGATGRIQLDKFGNRKAHYGFYVNILGDDGYLKQEFVGEYMEGIGLTMVEGALEAILPRIVRDRPMDVERELTLTQGLFVGMSVLSGLVALVILHFLHFTVTNSSNRLIRMSSPSLNVLSAVGALLLCVWIPITGFSHEKSLFCSLDLCLLLFGSTLIFTPMIMKQFRVLHVFHSEGINPSRLKDKNMIISVILWLFVDLVVLVLWLATSPFSIEKVRQSSFLDEEADELVTPFVYECQSHYSEYFLGFIYAYRGIMILVGAIIAWNVRGVQIQALNDSKWVGFSLYNAAFFAVILVPIQGALANHVDLQFALTAGCVLFAVLLSMCLMFVPKELAVRRKKDGSWTQNSAVRNHVVDANGKLSKLEESHSHSAASVLARFDSPDAPPVKGLRSRKVTISSRARGDGQTSEQLQAQRKPSTAHKSLSQNNTPRFYFAPNRKDPPGGASGAVGMDELNLSDGTQTPPSERRGQLHEVSSASEIRPCDMHLPEIDEKALSPSPSLESTNPFPVIEPDSNPSSCSNPSRTIVASPSDVSVDIEPPG